MKMKHKMFIISGPSSVGKSHFIQSGYAAIITGLAADAPVYIPGEGIPTPLPNNRDCFVHYNINRPAHFIKCFDLKNNLINKIKYTKWIFINIFKKGYYWKSVKKIWNYELDPIWRQLVSEPFIIEAIILIAREEILLERIQNRIFVEPKGFSRLSRIKYKSNDVRKFYKKINILDIYNIWIKELKEKHIPYTLIDTSKQTYRIIKSEKELYSIFSNVF